MTKDFNCPHCGNLITWKERHKQGIDIAKKKGLFKGRKPTLSDEKIQEVKHMVNLGIAKARIARRFGISRETLYSYLRKYI